MDLSGDVGGGGRLDREGAPMNAADVLITCHLCSGTGYRTYPSGTVGDCTRCIDGKIKAFSPRQVAALLAHGEQGQGVTIEADGDLHPKDPPPKLTEDERAYVETLRKLDITSATAKFTARLIQIIDRLVPVSAEVTDG